MAAGWLQPADARLSPPDGLRVVAIWRKLRWQAPAAVITRYERQFLVWFRTMVAARFSGVVLDYDGTVCATGIGHSPPAWPERAELLRLLAAGHILGFASGRGRSLHRELRGWVPEPRWSQVIVGMYNGGVIRGLTEELSQHGEIPRPDVSREAAADLAEAQARLSAYARTVRMDVRLGQVTVKARHEGTSHQALTALTRSVLALPPLLAVRVLESAHAVDIVPARVSKASVVTAVADLAGGPVLAIGDQGQPGGNDFALLAHQPLSLSVDRCSADPTRCWNLAPPGVSGPAALRRYLAALRLDSSGLAAFHLE
jgi:HAD superfamily hydrolase (TIGR01484 family)